MKTKVKKMNKEAYRYFVKNNYDTDAQELLLKQIELFFNKQEINKTKYNVGDSVFLKKGTYLHGIPGELENFDWILENGFIGI
jgi:hypothetical protein